MRPSIQQAERLVAYLDTLDFWAPVAGKKSLVTAAEKSSALRVIDALEIDLPETRRRVEFRRVSRRIVK